MYTPLVDEFTLQIHEIWPSLNPYGPSKCSGGVFERSIWNSKCSGGAFRILNAPAEHLKILMLRSGAERSVRIFKCSAQALPLRIWKPLRSPR